MTIYEESVELVPLPERIFYLLLAVALIGGFWWAVRAWWGLSGLGELVFLAIETLIAVALMVQLGVASNLHVRVSAAHLTLRAGFIRKSIPLANIVEAKPIAVGTTEHTWGLFDFLLPLLISRAIKSQVQVHMWGGEFLHFSTRQPEHVAELINRSSQEAFRQQTLSLAQKL